MIVKYDRQTFIVQATRNTKGRSVTILLPSCLTGLESVEWQLTMFCFYWWNRLIQTSQTGGQPYRDSIPWQNPTNLWNINWSIWKHPCCISLILCKNDFLMRANQNALKRNIKSLKCSWNLPQESISWAFLHAAIYNCNKIGYCILKAMWQSNVTIAYFATALCYTSKMFMNSTDFMSIS
jgi:hypothetical protein